MLLHLLRDLRRSVYPDVCFGCDALLADRPGFCPACTAAITSDPNAYCPRCGTTTGDYAATDDGCPRCRGDRFHYESVTRLGLYDGLLRDLILRMKQRGSEALAANVGRLWAAHQAARFRELGINLVVPVPLHWSRRIRRGYNQSDVLAEAVAKELRVEYRPHAVRRVRATVSQVHLSPTDRRTNLRGAFRPSRGARLAGRTVLIIDDVLTTGTTATETARAVKEAGAARIFAAVLAHR